MISRPFSAALPALGIPVGKAMLLLLHAGLDSAGRRRTVAEVEALAARLGGAATPPRGVAESWDRCMKVQVSGVNDETDNELSLFCAIEGVEKGLCGDLPLFGLAGAAEHLTLQDARFGKGDFSFLAGPCSIEDRASLLPLAKELRRAGVTVLRGGAFKPRTSPYDFQGRRTAGLELMAEVAQEAGLAVVTEVLDPRHVAWVSDYADMLQIGSRNMANQVLLREAGASGRPVMLKRGMSATIAEFLLAAECLADAGAEQIVLCERGLRHFDPAFRNLLDLAGVAALKQRCSLPVVVDPSHGTGRADLVAPMMVAAAAAGADGLLVEVHSDPKRSVSDAAQAITPAAFAAAAAQVEVILKATGRRLASPSPFPIHPHTES